MPFGARPTRCLVGARLRRATRRASCDGSRTAIEEHGESSAQIESQNVGKPISGARARGGDGRRRLPLLRRCDRQTPRRDDPVAGRRRHDLPRAARASSGLIVPWNFPLNIASWKDRPGARGREHRRPKPAELTPPPRCARRARSGGADPRGRTQCHRRQGLGRRPAARRASRRREDRVHRLDRGRPRGNAGRRRHDQARHARARRQVRERDLRRRRPRSSSGRRPLRRLRQRRPGLLRAQPHPRRALGLRRLRHSCSSPPRAS